MSKPESLLPKLSVVERKDAYDKDDVACSVSQWLRNGLNVV